MEINLLIAINCSFSSVRTVKIFRVIRRVNVLGRDLILIPEKMPQIRNLLFYRNFFSSRFSRLSSHIHNIKEVLKS